MPAGDWRLAGALPRFAAIWNGLFSTKQARQPTQTLVVWQAQRPAADKSDVLEHETTPRALLPRARPCRPEPVDVGGGGFLDRRAGASWAPCRGQRCGSTHRPRCVPRRGRAADNLRDGLGTSAPLRPATPRGCGRKRSGAAAVVLLSGRRGQRSRHRCSRCFRSWTRHDEREEGGVLHRETHLLCSAPSRFFPRAVVPLCSLSVAPASYVRRYEAPRLAQVKCPLYPWKEEPARPGSLFPDGACQGEQRAECQRRRDIQDASHAE